MQNPFCIKPCTTGFPLTALIALHQTVRLIKFIFVCEQCSLQREGTGLNGRGHCNIKKAFVHKNTMFKDLLYGFKIMLEESFNYKKFSKT